MARGRPPLDIGTYGEITTSGDRKPYKARARYRDRDGVTRTVARFGQTKSDARTRLRAALADRQVEAGIGLRGSTSLAELAREWLEEVDASTRSVSTRRLYRGSVERCIVPAVGSVRIAEATTPVCDSALHRIARIHGKGAAKTARAVLNGMFGLAIRHDAVIVNPVRETRPISTPGKRARALTDVEERQIVAWLAGNERARLLDLPDLVDFGLATGCRIGEALAVRDSVLDLDAGTVEINATVIRVKGVGLVVQEKTKSAAGWRVLALPPYAVAILRRRQGEVRLRPPSVLVMDEDGKVRSEPARMMFPAPLARTVRDPSNTAGDLRELLDGLGAVPGGEDGEWSRPFRWVTFHTFRKTVATRMEAAGCTPREVADQLGHSHPSMTQDHYFGRLVTSARAATVLERPAVLK